MGGLRYFGGLGITLTAGVDILCADTLLAAPPIINAAITNTARNFFIAQRFIELR